jgi:hypothetical protein
VSNKRTKPRYVLTPKELLTYLKENINEVDATWRCELYSGIEGVAESDAIDLANGIITFHQLSKDDLEELPPDRIPELISEKIFSLPGLAMAAHIGEVSLRIYLYQLFAHLFAEQSGSPTISQFRKQWRLVSGHIVELIVAKVRDQSGLPLRLDGVGLYHKARLWKERDKLREEMENWISPGNDASQ